MVRLKFAVSATKQWIGLDSNRNKTEGAVVGFLEFEGIFLRVERGL
jgi:hypothetical protein